MKKYLIEEKKYYKTNLHSHSTHSDGRLTLEENIKAYKEKGYNIYAVTDHCYMENFHEKFTTKDFVVINGYENAIWKSEKFIEDDKIRGTLPVYHFNFFAKDPNNQAMVGITKDGYYRFHEKVLHPENEKSEYYGGKFAELNYSVDSVNEMIEQANKAGFLVQYNHPVWSLNEPEDFLGFKGLWALEIYNSECVATGYNDENPYIYDLMLRDGQRICVTADDDNHSWQSMFDGFTMIGANELTYKGVIEAMERNDLYASTGPTIDYIYYEDGKFFVKCSNAVSIKMSTATRHARKVVAKDGEITTAVFDDFDVFDDFKYYRFEITDKTGKKAYTRAYFIDEIK
jgi:hypothetical protein